MFRLNKILTYLSNVVKNSFKSVIDFVDNLKSSTIDRLLVMKKIPFNIMRSVWFKSIVDFLGRYNIIDSSKQNPVPITPN